VFGAGRRAGVADGAGEHGDDVVQGADEGGEGVGAGGFAQVVVGRVSDLGLGAVEVEVVQDGVDVQEQAWASRSRSMMSRAFPASRVRWAAW
jgi:hypothetical protein